MAVKIEEAIFRSSDEESIIKLDDLNKDLYENTFKGRIFCPHPGCNAPLVFSSQNIKTKHFKIWPRVKHIETCLYYKPEGDGVLFTTRRSGPASYSYNISDKHLKSVLRNAVNKLKGKPRPTPKPKANPKKQIQTSVKNTGSGEAVSLLERKETIPSKQREGKVFTIEAKDISELNTQKIFCVIGSVLSVKLEEKYAEIVLKRKDRAIKVKFEESFISIYPNEFERFKFIKRYVNDHKSCTIICIGKIISSNDGYDIEPDRPEAFYLNGKPLNQIAIEYIRKGLS